MIEHSVAGTKSGFGVNESDCCRWVAERYLQANYISGEINTSLFNQVVYVKIECQII